MQPYELKPFLKTYGFNICIIYVLYLFAHLLLAGQCQDINSSEGTQHFLAKKTNKHIDQYFVYRIADT